MIRGIERRNIFRTRKGREDFLQRLEKLLPETGTACYGWALLSNHAHFLFRTGTVPLSNLMRSELVGGGLIRSLGGWEEVKRSGREHGMRDERILGESDFVETILSEAGEALNRQYILKASGYDLQRIAGRAASLLGIEAAEIFSSGRQSAKSKARSLVCFWAVRGLGMPLADLARTFAISIPGISYAVVRGEVLARSNGYTLDEQVS